MFTLTTTTHDPNCEMRREKHAHLLIFVNEVAGQQKSGDVIRGNPA